MFNPSNNPVEEFARGLALLKEKEKQGEVSLDNLIPQRPSGARLHNETVEGEAINPSTIAEVKIY